MPLPSPVLITHDGPVAIITINRPERRNAVDAGTAQALYDAFLAFDADASASVAVLTGAGEHFCSGADLKAIAAGAPNVTREGGVGTLAPTGPSRLRPSKPVIAAIEGYAVAGGLELALWADMRVASQTAVFGVFCRRFGVPLIDLGSIRLPRLIGHSRAMDMILTGRAVEADEALAIGLANRLAPKGGALAEAVKLAHAIAAFPQACLRADRASALAQWYLSEEAAMLAELRGGLAVIASSEIHDNYVQFAGGAGRHGT